MSDWYYSADNEQKGPINESELKENLAANKLSGDTLVWKEGMENWTPANQVAALSFRQPPTPAKVQPPATPAPAAPAPASGTSPAPAPSAATASPAASVQPVDLKNLMGKPESLEVTPEDAEKNKVFGILAYIGILFLVPLLAAKDSPFAKYHANQGLVLFLVEIALCIVLTVINMIGMFLPAGLTFILLILNLVYFGPLVLFVLGIINAANGKCAPLPIIGGIKLL